MFPYSNMRADSPHPDDTIGNCYWNALDAKTKVAFLQGFRLGTGLNTFGTPQSPRTLDFRNIPKIISEIDAFYKVAENEHVYLRDAIEVCLMQVLLRPKEDIADALNRARSHPFEKH